MLESRRQASLPPTRRGVGEGERGAIVSRIHRTKQRKYAGQHVEATPFCQNPGEKRRAGHAKGRGLRPKLVSLFADRTAPHSLAGGGWPAGRLAHAPHATRRACAERHVPPVARPLPTNAAGQFSHIFLKKSKPGIPRHEQLFIFLAAPSN